MDPHLVCAHKSAVAERPHVCRVGLHREGLNGTLHACTCVQAVAQQPFFALVGCSLEFNVCFMFLPKSWKKNLHAFPKMTLKHLHKRQRKEICRVFLSGEEQMQQHSCMNVAAFDVVLKFPGLEASLKPAIFSWCTYNEHRVHAGAGNLGNPELHAKHISVTVEGHPVGGAIQRPLRALTHRVVAHPAILHKT